MKLFTMRINKHCRLARGILDKKSLILKGMIKALYFAQRTFWLTQILIQILANNICTCIIEAFLGRELLCLKLVRNHWYST